MTLDELIAKWRRMGAAEWRYRSEYAQGMCDALNAAADDLENWQRQATE